MAIKIYSYTVPFDQPQRLQASQGEDVEYRLAFLGPAGAPIDMTGAQSATLTIRAKDGTLLVARSYSGFLGDPKAGTPRFVLVEGDTLAAAIGLYDVDVEWVDATGYRAQLLCPSTFEVLYGVGKPSDPVTTPPSGFGGRVPFLATSSIPALVTIYNAPDNQTARLRITLSARRRSDGVSFGCEFVGSIKKVGAVTSAVGAGLTQPEPADDDAGGLWTPSFSLSGNALQLGFSVDAGTIDGAVRVEVLTAI